MNADFPPDEKKRLRNLQSYRVLAQGIVLKRHGDIALVLEELKANLTAGGA